MNIEQIRDYCIAKKATSEELPFDEITLVFKVMGKIYLCVSLDNPDLIILKCDPEYALELREKYVGIIEGAFHFNKKYWNQIRLDSGLKDEFITQLIDHSYNEVMKKFTKKMRDEYNRLS